MAQQEEEGLNKDLEKKDVVLEMEMERRGQLKS